MIWLLVSYLAADGPVVEAAPYRSPPLRAEQLSWRPGLRTDVIVIKLAEGQGLSFDPAGISGPGDLVGLQQLLDGATSLFQRSPAVLRAERLQRDPDGQLADLSLYLRLHASDAMIRGNQLLQDPRIETVYLASEPVVPPGDIAPATPDFSSEQVFLDASPAGFGFDIAYRWPGADGSNIVIANIEYGFDATHEEFEDLSISTLGYQSGLHQYHGNGVLGMLIAPDNGYGVTGMVPGAEMLMVSPYVEPDFYDVAVAIDMATQELDAGDILLIEQQWVEDGIFLPVERLPAVFDAITLAVAKGIVVIEPSGNGGCDLDDPRWDGWFDRTQRDSGAIIVGGGASPLSGLPPRSWYPLGGCYGERVDVQGWYDAGVTASAADGVPAYVDLFFPEEDGRQAYTASFGGTSAAAPMVAAVAAAANSMAWETRGGPWEPTELRAAMVGTGMPQAEGDDRHIGPQPDLRQFLRVWGVR
ncbi:MAG: S8 family serine peptidase [Myxococcota bacterium]